MRGRPNLYTDYQKESSIFSNNTQKSWFGILVTLSFAFCFIASDYWILLLTTSFLIAIAGWGLNIVSGLAGQINLAHGVFIGVGTYASAVIGGISTSSVVGFDLDMIFWLPLAGVAAAIVGLLIAPITVKLKGLNLALVTLALVFIGSHLFSNFKSVTGGAGLGRKVATLKLFGVNLEKGIEIGTFYLQKTKFFICSVYLHVFLLV